MNIVIIPARGGSKGIPLKNIVNVAGKPLIAWSILRAKAAKCVDKVFVSTDNSEIAAIAEKFGAEIIKRPDEISGDTASSETALLHAVDYAEKKFDLKIGKVVFLQATSPVRTEDDIDKAMEVFTSSGADSLFSGRRVEDYFIWEAGENGYKSVNYDYKNRRIRQNIKSRYLENGSIYIFTPELLRKEKNRLGGKIEVYEMPVWKSFQIDESDDIQICEFYLRAKILKERIF